MGSFLEGDQNVHVLGLGSIGTFAAFSLADIPRTPRITLLLHKPSLYECFVKNKGRIAMRTTEQKLEERSGYNAEVLKEGAWIRPTAQGSGETSIGEGWQVADEPIENLIIATKTIHTVQALRPLQHRLTAESSILFLQNGMGMVEEINEKLFTDARTRPQFLLGVITHGVGMESPFNIVHTGFAATSIGPASPDMDISKDYLLGALPKSRLLNATAYSFEGILQMQLIKLANNSICNPFCALNDAKMGILLEERCRDLIREHFAECSKIVCAIPEVQGVEGVKERFSAENLEATMNGIWYKNRESTCSMVWDVRAGRETEIRFINGYWLRRGRELGIETPVNSMHYRQILEKHP